jgi:hypothetical protein
MVETNTKIGIAGILTALLAFGGYVVLTPEQVDYAYVCINGVEPPTWGVFYGGISSTGLTAYPFKENKTSPTKCANGVWVKLTKYASEKGIDPLSLIQELQKPVPIVESQSGVSYVCGPNKAPCVKME